MYYIYIMYYIYNCTNVKSTLFKILLITDTFFPKKSECAGLTSFKTF